MEVLYAEEGARILQARKMQGLTRERLAETADISVQFLADIERGAKNMTVTTLRKLAAALSLSTDYIVNGTAKITSEEEAAWLELYKALPPEKRAYALDILRVFLQASRA